MILKLICLFSLRPSNLSDQPPTSATNDKHSGRWLQNSINHRYETSQPSARRVCPLRELANTWSYPRAVSRVLVNQLTCQVGAIDSLRLSILSYDESSQNNLNIITVLLIYNYKRLTAHACLHCFLGALTKYHFSKYFKISIYRKNKYRIWENTDYASNIQEINYR